MNWERLFAEHILERGYDYYCENAVEILNISKESIQADVIGTEDYEVEITFRNGKITDMYCSCPYAEDGHNCKHMAAVLYEWSEEQEQEELYENPEKADPNLFGKASTTDAYQKKTAAIQKLIEQADPEVVRSCLADILAEDEKLLLRFYSMVKQETTEEDVDRYIEQIDHIINRYLGRDHFISYYEADDFLSELTEILDTDVRRMMDDADYRSAFRLMNHLFLQIGNVDMDDSDGGSGMLADEIYQFWLELLEEVDNDEKQEMFRWFTSHLNGSVVDYLEEYIEQIIMEEFNEKEFEQPKRQFVEHMIHASDSKDSDWSRSYAKGKWALRYLRMIEREKNPNAKIEKFCREYWDNASVRKYYIDHCMKNKNYDLALEALDESIQMDRNYRGLISDYHKKKKEIYLLQGDQDSYVKELWKLVLEIEAGNLELYRELKRQYPAEEWLKKREELFEKLPPYARIDQLYKEEKLYDRLLAYVMKCPGLYTLQVYEEVLKKEYPEPLLQKYRTEVDHMAIRTGDRKKYQEMVGILRRMKKIRGGSQVVEAITKEWKAQYRNRPAMMDELRKL